MLCASLFVFGLLQTAEPAQVSEPDPVVEALRRFDSMSREEQQEIADEMMEAVLGTEHPLLRAAVAVAAHPRVSGAARLARDPARAWSAQVYAPALELETRILGPETTDWRQIRDRFLLGENPPPASHWTWDSGRDALLPPAVEQAPHAMVEALMRGRWPSDGLHVAYAAGALDARDELGAAADYFAHHYRDRSGRVFRGITLYAMWGSGREIEVSDVEAVAWVREVEGRDDVVSPIPQPMHGVIYPRIRDRYALVREEVVLREALALRLLDPGAPLPATLKGVAPLIEDAWVALRHDPARMEALLERSQGRAEVLAAFAELAAADRAEDADETARDAHRTARTSLAGTISAVASESARNAGLLGFARR